jgi:hypothetical protein
MTGTEQTKAKTLQIGKKQKTLLRMNNVIQFEDRVSRSRSKHEGESSASPCDRLDLTRASSQRQLPTDHDYAVSTREYQLDQSSPLPATAAADPVLETQQQKQTHESVPIDRVTPYQGKVGSTTHSEPEWTNRPEPTVRHLPQRRLWPSRLELS